MSTMTNEEIIKVVQASIDGEQIEYKRLDVNIWQDLIQAPRWNFMSCDYRIKELTLEEFIEERTQISNDVVYPTAEYQKGIRAALRGVSAHMKKLQGEVR